METWCGGRRGQKGRETWGDRWREGVYIMGRRVVFFLFFLGGGIIHSLALRPLGMRGQGKGETHEGACSRMCRGQGREGMKLIWST